MRQQHPSQAGATGHAYGIVRQEKTSRDGTPIGMWTANAKRQGREIQRPFFDQVLGGRESALGLAMAWLDAMLRLIPPVTKRQAQTRLRRNNTSGTSGVFPKRVNGRLVSWRATLDTPERSYCKSFSIKIYGEEHAKELAIAERQSLLQQHGADTFITLNAQATQEATQHFAHLLDNPQSATSPAQIAQRIHALNQWFDQLHPAQLYVRLRVYPARAGSTSNIASARILFTGAPSRVATKGLYLVTRSYAQRLPEMWQFIQATITTWQGQDRWQDFAARHESAFMASTAETGFQARDYGAPPNYPQCLTPPALLQPMLAGFELPALPYLAPPPPSPIHHRANTPPTLL